MVTKLVVVLALVALAHSSVVPVPAAVDADYTSFSYGVADPYTGDYKSQAETRVGGNVVGQYSLLDPDGTKRTVDYAADDYNGFNAVVRKDPIVPVVAAGPVVGPAVIPSRIIAAAPAPIIDAHGPLAAGPAPIIAAHGPVLDAHAHVLAAPAAVVAAPAVASHSHTVTTHTISAGPGVYAAAAPVLSRTIATPAIHSHLTYAPHAPALAYW